MTKPRGSVRTSRTAAVVLAGFAGAAQLCVGLPAWSFEQQHQTGVDLGVAVLAEQGRSGAAVGPTVGFHYQYGVSDQFLFVGEAAYSRLPFETDPAASRNQPADVCNGGLGVGYVLDVLRWVPYGAALGGAHVLSGGTLDTPRISPSVTLALGLDYQVERWIVVGFAYRQAFLFSELDDYPSYSQFFGRAALSWGY